MLFNIYFIRDSIVIEISFVLVESANVRCDWLSQRPLFCHHHTADNNNVALQKNETKRRCKGTTRTHAHSERGRESASILHDKEIIREINYSFD